jgi:hypothetical protein
MSSACVVAADRSFFQTDPCGLAISRSSEVNFHGTQPDRLKKISMFNTSEPTTMSSLTACSLYLTVRDACMGGMVAGVGFFWFKKYGRG